MAFAHRRAWIEDEQIRPILAHDGYRRLPEFSLAEEGDIIVYVSMQNGRLAPSHVAVVLQRKIVESSDDWSGIMVLSKWGQHGEYIHRMEDVHLYLGRPEECWTERKRS